jgi:hypothetical protein
MPISPLLHLPFEAKFICEKVGDKRDEPAEQAKHKKDQLGRPKLEAAEERSIG